MTKSLYFLLLLIIGVSCSDSNKREKSIQTKIDQLQRSQDSINPLKVIKIAKEIKKDAEFQNYSEGISECNIILMNTLANTGKNKDAIQLGKENEKYIKKIKNNYRACINYRILGAAYLNIGLSDEGQNCLNKALKYNEGISKHNQKYYELALVYSGLATAEKIRTNSPELIQTKYLKELWAIQQIDDGKTYEIQKNNLLSFLYMNMGVLNVQQQKTKEAEQYFRKALDICTKYNLKRNTPLMLHNETAWLLFDQKKYDSCISHAQKGIVFEKNNSKPIIRRDLYEVLYKSYTEKDDAQNSSKYGKLYMKLNDSMIDAEQRAINAPVKNIIAEKNEEHKSNLTYILIIIGSVLLIVSLFIFLLWRRNQKIFHSRYKNIISQLKNEEINSLQSSASDTIDSSRVSSTADKNINIQDSTINTILQKLDKFEKSKKFLKKDINMTSLASSLDTNPRYLSEIIKQYKEKNFNNYLNGLRIQYIMQLLYKEPIYREYKITYLAEYCGFASREVFAIAFKKETGVTPSYFIEQLRAN
ncbi:hypothetical protein GCM10022217_24160 [Chryseobacterium ginsenosidimutans]|uniref:helix-turn-helix transcriptional regulator n=1 Tax=Chryseobacterium ginsenosidimutans TaxID=687846 RepID=UPI0031D3B22E